MTAPVFSLKEIQSNPELCCTTRWGETEKAKEIIESVKAYLTKLEALKQQLKVAKSEKQICAREFGAAKTAGTDLSTLKEKMQRTSDALTDIETQRKQIEESLSALFLNEAPSPRLTPLQFDACGARWSGDTTISLASDIDATVWDQYVANHPQASLYHRFCWRDIIHNSFDHPTFYLLARDADKCIRGILPLVRLRSRLFGDFSVSVPFFNYGGVLADSEQIGRRLLEHAAAIAKHEDMGHLEIRATHVLNDWPKRTDKVSMIRHLPQTSAELDDELGSKIRAQIKRAHQEDIEIRRGHAELLDDFYKVFAINMRDLGTPVYGKNFFANILGALPEQSHIVCAYLKQKPVATAFLLGHGDMMEIPWASTLRSVNAAGINMALYRDVLGFCIERHYTFFDFGRSTKDAGTYRFKKQWGAQPQQHYWHYWLKEGGELPELKPDSPKFRLLIAIWQRLPVALTKLIGPPVVKFLP